MSDEQALGRTSLFRGLGPVVGVVLLAVLYVRAPGATPSSLPALLRAAIVIAVVIVATVALPWHRLPSSLLAVPPLIFLGVASTLRVVAAGGGSAAMVPAGVLLVPVFWLALYATQAELAIGLAGLGVAVLSALLARPAGEASWAGAIVLMMVGSAGGLAVHGVAEGLRRRSVGLARLVRTDPLTGVRNRRAWDEALAALARQAVPAAVLVLDLDRFKEFNEEHGSQAGDRLLKEVAAAWSVEVRQSDLLARLGGDEFGVLLPRCPREKATQIAQRLRDAMPAHLTCSAGIAWWDGRESATEPISRADRALYRAKASGRDRVEMDGRELVPEA